MVGEDREVGNQCRDMEAPQMKPKTIAILGLLAIVLSFFAGVMVMYPQLLQARRQSMDDREAKELADLRRENAQDSIVMYEERFRIHLEHDTMYNDSIQRKMDDIILIKRFSALREGRQVTHPKTFYDSIWSKRWGYKPK